MDPFRTVAEVKDELDDSITGHLDPDKALQQLIEAMYAMGRLPGSVQEETIGTSSAFIDEDDDGNDEKRIHLAPGDYDGALMFRTKHQGYYTKTLAAIYQRIKAGAEYFIDMGYVLHEGDRVRAYRVPPVLKTTSDIIRALVKQRPPVLEDGDEFPIRSIHAIKLGLQAVGYEDEGDPDTSEKYWQMCLREIEGDKKEFEGLPQRRVNFRDSTRRRSTNRM